MKLPLLRLAALTSLLMTPHLIAQPANDDLADAFVINAIPFSGNSTSLDATLEPDEATSCSSGRDNSIWWTFTPSQTERVKINVNGSVNQSLLSVWTGSAHPLTEIGCVLGNRVSQEITFEADAGTTYYIRVVDIVGGNDITINLLLAPKPANDDLADAFVIDTVPFSGTSTSLDASLEHDEVGGSCSGISNSVWWRFTPNQTDRVKVNVNGSANQSILSVWTGSAHPLTEVGCVLGNRVSQEVSFKAEAGTTYYIRVVNVTDIVEGDDVTVNLLPAPVPENDDLANALVIDVMPFSGTGTSFNASSESGEAEASCTGNNNSVWWAFTPSQTERVKVNVNGSVNQSVVSVWTGSTHPLTEIGCVLGNDVAGTVIFEAEAGTTYYIRVVDVSDIVEGDEVTVNLLPAPKPSHDDLADAIVIDALPYSGTSTSFNADLEPDEVKSDCGGHKDSIWWRFTPDETRNLEVNTTDSEFQNQVSIWTGSAHPLTEDACSGNVASKIQNALVYNFNAGTTYYIRVVNVSGVEGGEVNLSLSVSLPVELVSFDGIADEGAIRLTWTTASETDNAGFELQRGNTWETMAFIDGHGTTTESHTYRHVVQDLPRGIHRFRLKQHDYDGTFSYSPEIEVELDVANGFLISDVYPNPFAETTTFTLTVEEPETIRVEVFDVSGRRVGLLYEGLLRTGTPHRFTFKAGALASGWYLIRSTGETFLESRRVLLTR